MPLLDAKFLKQITRLQIRSEVVFRGKFKEANDAALIGARVLNLRIIAPTNLVMICATSTGTSMPDWIGCFLSCSAQKRTSQSSS